MPLLFRLKCESCDYSTPTQCSDTLYLLINGERTILPHPLEEYIAEDKTGRPFAQLQQEGLIGNFTPFLCLDCGEIAALDYHRDEMHCPICKSQYLTAAAEISSAPCPICKEGIVVTEQLGIS